MKQLNTPLPSLSKELHKAVSCAHDNNLEPISSLINAKADPNAKDNDDKTVLHKLACNGDSNKVKVISLILNAKADPNAKDNHGKTPLFEANSSRGIFVEKTLINHNADINHQDLEGNTVLHNLFLSTNTIDINIKLIFLLGAVIKHNQSTLNLVNKDGTTPLYCAAFGNSKQQEGECIQPLGLLNGKNFITLAQDHNVKLSLSSNELNRLNLALEQSKQQNLYNSTDETTENIKIISQFLSEYLIESVDESAIEHADDYYPGVD